MSLILDASAAVALHFADERGPFEGMEDRLAEGEEAFTAPNFFQEVMEALRQGLPLWTRDSAVCNKAPRVAVEVLP